MDLDNVLDKAKELAKTAALALPSTLWDSAVKVTKAATSKGTPGQQVDATIKAGEEGAEIGRAQGFEIGKSYRPAQMRSQKDDELVEIAPIGLDRRRREAAERGKFGQPLAAQGGEGWGKGEGAVGHGASMAQGC